MLIKALCDYALKQEQSRIPEGWQEQKISFRILLTPEGEIKEIIDSRGDVPIKNKKGETKRIDKKPRSICVPFRPPTSSTQAYYIDHRPAYIFGLEMSSDGSLTVSAKGKKSHAAFVKHELEFFKDLNSEMCLAYKNFVERWDPEQMASHPALVQLGKEYKTAYFGFGMSIGESMLEEDPQFCAKYNTYLKAKSEESIAEETAMCCVLGKTLPIARIHNKISGFPGGKGTGCALVGMNDTAFESYGKTQSYNSNVSEEAMKLYTDALNALLADRTHYKVLDELVLLYFAMKRDDAAECSFYSQWIDVDDTKQDNVALDALMQSVRQGKLNTLAEKGLHTDTMFYVVGLTPNSSRLCQKFIVRDQFGVLIGNLAQHQRDIAVVENQRMIGFEQIKKQLISPKSSNDKVPPPLMTAIMLAAMQGTNYPEGLFSTVIRRVKTDDAAAQNQRLWFDVEPKDDIRYIGLRVGIIKAYLNRKARNRHQKEEFQMAWDETNLHPAYLCGGLFAVYEKIQADASGDLNRTIKDAYFASACGRPASIMPKLELLSKNHRKVIQREKGEGAAVYYQRLVGELMEGLAGTFPQTLSLDDQGRFIVGYYHMNRKLWTAKTKTENEEG